MSDPLVSDPLVSDPLVSDPLVSDTLVPDTLVPAPLVPAPLVPDTLVSNEPEVEALNNNKVDVEIEPDVKTNDVVVHICSCSFVLNCFSGNRSAK